MAGVAVMQGMDVWLLLLINNGLAHPSLDNVMVALSSHGYLLFFPYLFALLVLSWKERSASGASLVKQALIAVLVPVGSFFLADALADSIKPVVARLRPCQVIEGVRLLVRCPHSYSMPSGHAISSFAAASALFYLSRLSVPLLARCYPLLLAALIALSRIYLGVHYPSDVIVGALIGSAVAILLSMVSEGLVPCRRERSRVRQNTR